MSNKMREDRFTSHKGELEASMPQCKECDKCIISDGLQCTELREIPLDIRLNKIKCNKFLSEE